MHVSEIRVKQIRVNQGLGVFAIYQKAIVLHKKLGPKKGHNRDHRMVLAILILYFCFFLNISKNVCTMCANVFLPPCWIFKRAKMSSKPFKWAYVSIFSVYIHVTRYLLKLKSPVTYFNIH